MKLVKGLMLVAIAGIIFSACKDKEDDEETPANTTKTKTELITSGSWVLNDLLLNDTSMLGLMDACEKDDITTFTSNGKMTVDEGPSKCDPMDPQSEVLDWKFYMNETKIILDGDTADLVTLNATDIVVKMHDEDDNHFTMKLKKK